jgi:hypothetical protein
MTACNAAADCTGCDCKYLFRSVAHLSINWGRQSGESETPFFKFSAFVDIE